MDAQRWARLDELFAAAGGSARVEGAIAGSLSLFADEGGPPLRLGDPLPHRKRADRQG